MRLLGVSYNELQETPGYVIDWFERFRVLEAK